MMSMQASTIIGKRGRGPISCRPMERGQRGSYWRVEVGVKPDAEPSGCVCGSSKGRGESP